MNKFETNQCPLCGEVLKLRRVCGVNVFSCPTVTLSNHTHYEVEVDGQTSIQHMYVGSWSIDNFANSSRSRIYKQTPHPSGTGIRWKLMTEVSHIRPDLEASMSERLEKLMMTYE